MREFRLDGDRLVSVLMPISGLHHPPISGMVRPLELAPTEGSGAVKSVELFAGGGGLALGTEGTSAIFLAVIVAVVVYLTVTKKDQPPAVAPDGDLLIRD